jgi:hypothetical protein
MKKKYVIAGLIVLIAGGGLWFGRTTWRVRHQLVSLNVRNMPLVEVLHKIEGQTRQKIRTENQLDARITLNVTDKPLAYVLDLLSEQSGARWSTVYAVYNSSIALSKLESALRGDGKLETVGWTKIAPIFPLSDLHSTDGPHVVHVDGASPEMGGAEPNMPPGRVITATEDVEVKAPGDGKAGTKPAGSKQHRPMMMKIVRRGGGGDGAMTEEEIWTPEEMVIETVLSGRLGNEKSGEATPAAADLAARKVSGRWTTFIALRKSRLGMDFGGLRQITPRIRTLTAGNSGINGNGLEENLDPSNLEESLARRRNDEFGRLTPEQRVARARDRQRFKQD